MPTTASNVSRRSPVAQWVRPGLLAESSRGCWWGEKSHCTFCGLNGDGMRYRAKWPDRVLAELAELAEMDARYGLRNVQFVDNILDMSYLRTLLPKLAESPVRYDLFYEIKANLKRDQVKMLRLAGFLSFPENFAFHPCKLTIHLISPTTHINQDGPTRST